MGIWGNLDSALNVEPPATRMLLWRELSSWEMIGSHRVLPGSGDLLERTLATGGTFLDSWCEAGGAGRRGRRRERGAQRGLGWR